MSDLRMPNCKFPPEENNRAPRRFRALHPVGSKCLWIPNTHHICAVIKRSGTNLDRKSEPEFRSFLEEAGILRLGNHFKHSAHDRGKEENAQGYLERIHYRPFFGALLTAFVVYSIQQCTF